MREFEIYDVNDTKKIERDKRWPLVYLLKNKTHLYIGETTNIEQRLSTHSNDEEKINLNQKIIIKHNKANKSLTYLLESDLINRAFADKTFKIVNKKMQSNEVLSGHDFFEKVEYKKEIEKIWEKLRSDGIFKNGYLELETNELFKYSPWKEFSENQINVINKVNENINNSKQSFVSGGAGTGKTLIIIRIALNHALYGDKNTKIGIYAAKRGNDKTFRRVINNFDKEIKNKIKIISDLNLKNIKNVNHLLIDESQRLRKNNKNDFSSPSYFKENLANNELEWLKNNNIRYSLFYDLNQSFHKDDMNIIDYIELENQYSLNSQFRIRAGDDYINFIKELLQIIPNSQKKYSFNNYDFEIFSNDKDLYEKVLKINKSENFDNKSRMLASLKTSKWITKDLFNNLEKAKNVNYKNIETEFEFGEYKSVWNKDAHYNDWLERSDITEVGCVHTAQGRDFKYVGVIFGNDIDIIDGKLIASNETKNIYFILLTRGIWGHGLFTKNKKLNEYFKNFVSSKMMN